MVDEDLATAVWGPAPPPSACVPPQTLPAHPSSERPLASVIADAARARGIELAPDSAPQPRCEGGCGAPVGHRRAWCAACEEASRAEMRRLSLAPAFASVTLDGALDWCRAGTLEYVKATEKARELAAGNEHAVGLIDEAKWKRSWGSLLLLGPTGIGKSKIIVAIGLRILDAAIGGAIEEPFFHAAMRVRFVRGFDVAKAWAKHKLGAGDPPLLVQAKRASLLLLDEIGFEAKDADPHAIRDVIHARDDVNLPTLATSGRTRKELDDRYGEALTRRLSEPGRAHVINLHPPRRL